MEDTELNTPTIEFAPSEQIFPEMKEITQANITDIWNATDNIENLSCVNPMEIEGMEAARDILEAPIYFADQETTIEEAPVISIPEALREIFEEVIESQDPGLSLNLQLF